MFEYYVYPPRPEKKIPPSSLPNFERMNIFFGQPKMNGSCCVTVCNDEKVNFYNRHKETFGKFVFSKQEMRANFKEPGLAIFCGE